MAKETVIDEATYGCSADLNDYSPSCGWQHDDSGEKIWHSQGFCCACGVLDLLTIEKQFLRGTKCEFMSLSAGASSAHCLRFQEPYFSAFSLGSPYMSYQMKIGIAS